MCKEIYPQSNKTVEKPQGYSDSEIIRNVIGSFFLEHFGKKPTSVGMNISLNSITSKIEILAEYMGDFHQTIRIRHIYYLVGLYTHTGYQYWISRISEEKLIGDLL